MISKNHLIDLIYINHFKGKTMFKSLANLFYTCFLFVVLLSLLLSVFVCTGYALSKITHLDLFQSIVISLCSGFVLFVGMMTFYFGDLLQLKKDELSDFYDDEYDDEDFDDLDLPFEKEMEVKKGPGKIFSLNEKKVGRNQPCPCGSGKKYKNCCGKM